MRTKRIAIILMLVCVALCFIGCNNKVTSLKLVHESVYLSVGDKLDLDDCIEKEGKGKLEYSAEDPKTDIFTIDGSKLTAKKTGTGVVVIKGGDFSVKITINVNNKNVVSLSFEDKTVNYTGEKFYLVPSGYYSDDTVIKYTCDGKEFNGVSEAGVYEIKAEVTVPAGYKLICEKNVATLTINKADIADLGISFPGKRFKYDGKVKKVGIVFNGDSTVLPDGINAVYQNETATDVGTYNAKVTFVGNNPNYEPFPEMQCTYTIEPCYCYLGDYGFVSYTCDYDGNKHKIELSDLPDGVNAEYFELNNGNYVQCQNSGYVNSGSYTLYTRLTINEKLYKNYVFTNANSQLNFVKQGDKYVSEEYTAATLKINKSTVDSGKLVLRDSSGKAVTEAVYGNKISVGKRSAEGYSVTLEGGNYMGIKGEFEGKADIEYSTLPLNEYGNVNVGTYSIKANFSLPAEFTENYVLPQAPTIKFDVVKGTYNMNSVTFTVDKSEVDFDGTEYSFRVKGADLSENADYKIEYQITCKDGKRSEILHAGEYEIRAKFTLVKDWQNYLPIPDKVINFKINPRIVEISEIKFEDETITYDGNKHSPSVKGTLSEEFGILYLYEGASYEENIYDPQFVNAGIYPIKAFVTYGNWDSRDYVVTMNGNIVPYLTAIFTIKKADIAEMPDFGFTEECLKYTPGMKLSDIEFKSDNDGYYFWKEPDSVINLSPLKNANSSFVGGYTATVCYNYSVNRKNYNDIEKEITLEIERYKLDASLISVPNQFVATGADVYIAYPANYAEYVDDIFKINLTKDKDGNNAKISMEVKSFNYYAIKEVPQEDGSILYEDDIHEYSFLMYSYNPDVCEYKAGTCILTKYKGTGDNVIVPKGTSSIKRGAFQGKNISSLYVNDGTELSPGVFEGITYLDSLNLSSIMKYTSLRDYFDLSNISEFPKKITVRNDSVIPAWAYQSLSGLKEVVYESSVGEIKSNAFNGCYGLTKLTVANPYRIGLIGQNAFSGCINLQEVYLPDLNTKTLTYYFSDYTNCKFEKIVFGGNALAANTFKDIDVLKAIVMPADLEEIGAGAFSGCYATLDFSSVRLLTEITESVFDGYKGKTITLPDGLLKLGIRAFKNANMITQITLPDTITEIDNECFYGCSSLVSINMPTSLEIIGESAFYGTSALTELLLGENVTSIGYRAFSKCKADVIFAKNCRLSVLGRQAFYEYAGKKVCFPSGISKNDDNETIYTGIRELGERMFYKASNLEEITLPGSLRVIGTSCFEGCSLLQSVNIPEAVEEIGDYAFYKCYSITQFVFGNKNPPALPKEENGAFTTEGKFFKVYVPSGTKNDYARYFEACGCIGRCTIAETGSNQ